MSIEDPKVIDTISTNPKNEVVLTITDHLNWESDTHEHLLLLQEKINTYLSFIESDELNDAYPDAIGKSIVINITSKYEQCSKSISFLNNVKPILQDAGIILRHEVFEA